MFKAFQKTKRCSSIAYDDDDDDNRNNDNSNNDKSNNDKKKLFAKIL